MHNAHAIYKLRCSAEYHLACRATSILQVSVLNAKGAVLKPVSNTAGSTGQQQQPGILPPPSLSGAYLEVQEQALSAGLPLNPGASLSLPVTVVVGKPHGNMFDACTLKVWLNTHSASDLAEASTPTRQPVYNRCIATIPLQP